MAARFEMDTVPYKNASDLHSRPETSDRDISFRAVEPAEIAIRQVTVAVQGGSARKLFSRKSSTGKKIDEESPSAPKKILDGVSVDFPAGTLTAILGASGSGKTSLLNVLADRIHDARLDITGQISFNGNTSRASVESAYVMQQDVLIPTLTVRETLQYAADLRLRGDISQAERRGVVEQVILELSLKEAADTRLKYCSGGERRRTSLATQLLANPSILWLDEPTTGLDATSALQLVTLLKSLASKGRTIVLTIHQPRSEIWSLLDRVVLLSRGSSVYSGEVANCIKHFTNLDFPLPAFCNPAEHVIDVAAVDNRTPELEIASQARVENLISEWKMHSNDAFAKSWERHLQGHRPATSSWATKSLLSPQGQSFTRQVRVLSSRTFLTTIRDPLGLLGMFFEALFIGVTIGWIFFRLDGSLGGIRGRASAAYAAAALQGYLILMFETYRMILEIEVFDRERNEGVVSVPAFLISRRIAKLVEDVAIPLIFSIVFYWMCGLRNDGSAFMIFFATVLVSQFIAVNFATMAVAVTRDYAIASLIGNLSFTWQSFSCGFFVLTPNLPVYLGWSKWVAYVYFAFGLLMSNEFKDRTFDCPYPGGQSNSACAQYSGNFELEVFDIPSDWIWRPMVILVAWALGYLILAAVILQINRQEMRVASGRKDEADHSAGKERMRARCIEEVRAVAIQLEDYHLNVLRRSRAGFRFSKHKLEILKPINTTFEPGTLNVIMGPSGSGKTSLLSSMAHRLKSDMISRYDVKGKLLLNGAEPGRDVLESIVSYVMQDDNALLSRLTVRETLRFAAGLRLPRSMSKAAKHQRAEEVLLQLGLKDAANMTVGNDLVKGISGGERRRVSIAIQILTDPRILLLDEPTSGLDGFTAASIMEVLKGLADERRTIVMTVHQSRSDLWSSFGKVLLLARGGHPVYSGPPGQMLDHFASKGYECPKTTNPADFALDLITIDIRQAETEAASKERVQGLIDRWRETSSNTQRRQNGVIASPAELGSLRKTKAGFLTAFPIITHRSWLNIWRQPELMIGRIMQVFGLGIVLTLFFAPLKKDYYSIQSRLGFVQEIGPVYFVGMLNNIALYPFEQAVFYREHDDRAYNVEAFMLQYTVLEIPFEILTSLLFGLIAALAIGLPKTAEAYFVVAFNVFCITNCGESLGILFNTLIDHTGFAVNVMSVFLSLAQIMGGTMAINLNGFLQAFNHLSPIKWSFYSLAHVAFRGISFGCLDSQRLADGECPQQTGEDILKLYALDYELWKSILVLGAVTIGYRVFAYVVLKAKKEKWFNVLRR